MRQVRNDGQFGAISSFYVNLHFMRFSSVIGNEALKRRLVQMVDQGRLPHAVLLCERGEWGALPVAIALAQYLNCTDRRDGDSCGVCDSCHKYEKLIHPDLHFFFPVAASGKMSDKEKKAPVSDYLIAQWREKVLSNPYFGEQELFDALGLENKNVNIYVHEAKRLFEKLSLSSYEGDYKTVVGYLPEKMSPETANKLLKLLEEPPAGTVFIMVSHQSEKMLPTVLSRCQRIDLLPFDRQERAQAGLEFTMPEESLRQIEALLEAALAKDLLATFPVWESLAEQGRERQKEWIRCAQEYIRRLHLHSLSLGELAGGGDREAENLVRFSGRIRPTFYEKAFQALEGALSAVESNTNARLVFCNLCNFILLTV